MITPSPASLPLKSRPSDCAPLCGGQEGELRPQLLDRFGMSVIVHTMPDIAVRTRMVLDRLAFEQARSRCPQTLPYPSQLLPSMPFPVHTQCMSMQDWHLHLSITTGHGLLSCYY